MVLRSFSPITNRSQNYNCFSKSQNFRPGKSLPDSKPTFNLKPPEKPKSPASFRPSQPATPLFVQKTAKMSQVCNVLFVSQLHEIGRQEHCSGLIKALLLLDKSNAFTHQKACSWALKACLLDSKKRQIAILLYCFFSKTDHRPIFPACFRPDFFLDWDFQM